MRPGDNKDMNRRTAQVLLAIAVVCTLLLTPAAQASRPATSAEADAIRRAAVRTLEGRGWRVSHIRVSTARTGDRYAAAAVDNARTGVGGEMILRHHAGRWSRLFLGTNDFCTAAAPRAALNDLGFRCAPSRPRLRVEPVVVSPGGVLTLAGGGFRRSEAVRLYAGPPHSEADAIGATRADSRGAFRAAIPLSARATPGHYVVLACQRDCRLKATASFTIG